MALGLVPKSVVRRAGDLTKYLKPGEKLHGFTLLHSKHVPELELTALHLQHDRTGADYLHVAREDKNNVFSIGFKTNPPDNTGVPHILEHTTLCGSEKYPIRDPFFKMLPRTLSNFMNAFTASDHTFYPFSTTNDQDFKNLMSVYLDATLHPLLKQTDFTQEGWRIGPDNPRNPTVLGGAKAVDSKLVFKGVVYNEMKGQMSDAGYYFHIRFQDHIFPAIKNAGGDPQEMTDLTYEQLRAFHAEHYHPSNAKLYTYGDMPLADHLAEVDEQFRAFHHIQGDVEVRRPVSLSGGPRDVVVSGPFDPMVNRDAQHKTSTSWLAGDAADTLEVFSLGILFSLLMDGYGSPFYRNLIEDGLGTDWTSNTGYDISGRVGIFSVGLNGVKKVDVPRIREKIFETIRQVRRDGFEKSKVDGYLHQLELSLKHKTAHFGMQLLHRIKPKWFEGVHPFKSLAWSDTVSAFESKMANGGYLEGLMDKYLNDNTLTFTMAPSATHVTELVQEESMRLESQIAKLAYHVGSEAEAILRLEKQESDLIKEQDKSSSQDVSCLPTVYVKDIPRWKDKLDIRQAKLDGTSVQWRAAPTNGLTYFRAVNPLENLPDELRVLIPLFTDSIMRLGTKDMTMEQLEDLVKLKTGGINVGYHVTTSPSDVSRATEGICFSGTALDRNVPDMFRLMRKLLSETDFDSVEAGLRIRQLLRASADGAVNNVASSGHSYARGFAEAGLSSCGLWREQVGGLTQVELVTSLASRPVNEGMEDIIKKLKTIRDLVIAKSSAFRAAVTCGPESVSSNETALEKYFTSLRIRNAREACTSVPSLVRDAKTFFPLPYQVYYSALAVPTVSYNSASSAPLQVLAQLLTHKHMHHEIREKGGAYGGGAYSRGIEGVFGFYSYRDPNPRNTMAIMAGAGQWAVEREWTDGDLEEAKLSVFQALDAPVSVSEEGMTYFLSGVSEDMVQHRRERLLDVTKNQVYEVAQQYIADALKQGSGRLVLLGDINPLVDDTWETKDMNIAFAQHDLTADRDAE